MKKGKKDISWSAFTHQNLKCIGEKMTSPVKNPEKKSNRINEKEIINLQKSKNYIKKRALLST